MHNSSLTLYPNAKINIGLNIIRKRADGYHDIESLFYPVPLFDLLRIERSETFSFEQTGIDLGGDPLDNLVVRAYRLMTNHFHLPPVSIYLEKKIPVGAGLGGGSADAAFMICGLNDLFDLKCSKQQMASFAAELGSDCPFFVFNQPSMATGRGEILEPYDIQLDHVWILLVKPTAFVSTSQAYRGVHPSLPSMNLDQALKTGLPNWEKCVKNDFEESIFPAFAEIAELKEEMYRLGAIYASMSGSGSSVYGLFLEKPNVESFSSPDKIVLQSTLY